jgi:hypothetical protein
MRPRERSSTAVGRCTEEVVIAAARALPAIPDPMKPAPTIPIVGHRTFFPNAR